MSTADIENYLRSKCWDQHYKDNQAFSWSHPLILGYFFTLQGALKREKENEYKHDFQEIIDKEE